MKDEKNIKSRSPRKGKMGVTMVDVGKLAGVTQVTVSRALSDPSKVSSETLMKIREAIEKTGYVPNAIAGALASKKSMLISALVPSLTNITYSLMISSLNKAVSAEGYQVMLSETGYTEEEEERVLAAHLSRRPDAVVLTGVNHSIGTKKMLLAAGVPVVELWDISDTPIDVCVGFSHTEAGKAVADYVLGKGYKFAGTISAGDTRALRRKDAFISEFMRNGGEKSFEVNFNDEASLENGRKGFATLFERHNFKKGVIFCSSDILAHGVMIEAQICGLNIPNDIGVIGFSDQVFSPFTDPALTSVHIDRELLGQAAAASILNQVKGVGNQQRKKNDIGFTLIVRKSA